MVGLVIVELLATGWGQLSLEKVLAGWVQAFDSGSVRATGAAN